MHVEFEEVTASPSRTTTKSGLVAWIMTTFSVNKAQANYIMLGLVAICIVIFLTFISPNLFNSQLATQEIDASLVDPETMLPYGVASPTFE